MKYLSLIFGVLLFVVSCTESEKKDFPASSLIREQIVRQFNTVREQNDRQSDSLAVVEMELLAVTEPTDYKAMVEIAHGIQSAAASSYELALKSYEKSLWLVSGPNADTLTATALTGIGNCYKHTGNYPKALSHLYKALKIFENRNNLDGISRVNAYIGEVYMQKNDMESAKEHLKIAMKILENDKGNAGWLSAAHTLANIYGMGGDYENALKIDKIGLRVSDSINLPRATATFLDNKANCLMFMGKLDSAQYYFEECLKIDIGTGNKKQVADTYSNLGALASFRKDFDKAETLTLKSIDILKSVNNKYNLIKSYQILSEVYMRQGDYKKSLEAYTALHEEYKKMIDEKKEASLTEFKIIHDTEKKEKQLVQNEILLLQKNAEVRQRTNILIALSLLVFFLMLIGFLIYRQQLLKNRQQAQEHQLKTAISQIETQNKLQDQRLDISRDLHDNIGAQLTFIISSVDNLRYAFDIGNTKLDDKLGNISSFAKETIVELRDTIWAMNNTEIIFEDLRARILNFVEKVREVRESTYIRFEIEDQLSQTRLSSIIGVNIYRTIQEAVNNALKYSQASEIFIGIESESANIRITVKDNGNGYDDEAVEKGYGIINMEKRIADIGGSISITSKITAGTTIVILLPNSITEVHNI